MVLHYAVDKTLQNEKLEVYQKVGRLLSTLDPSPLPSLFYHHLLLLSCLSGWKEHLRRRH